MPRKPERKYATGWLETTEPAEDYVPISEHTWSSLYLTVQTHRVFKVVKRTGTWWRFTVLPVGEKA